MGVLAGVTWLLSAATPTQAEEFDVTIRGSDAIFLAGRTDLVIPPANKPWPEGMLRHAYPTPEEILETHPPTVPVSAGQVVRVISVASGWIHFFNNNPLAPPTPAYRPEGDGAPGSSKLSSFGGISGYIGTRGALVGVFLGPTIPNAGPPDPIDFGAPTGPGTDFVTLSPRLRQIFFIGNGKTRQGVLQEFKVPPGATRLALGIPDGYDFRGAPGFYDDNDGHYRIRIGVFP
jgi:hypothetical protein